MVHNPPFHEAEKETQQLQQWEKQVFARLEEARQIQARALQQCAQAQARVARLEARLKALREHLSTLQSAEDLSKAAETDEPESEQQPDENAAALQLPEQAESLASLLPENGDLESLESFPVQQDPDEEATERLAILQVEEQA